MKVCTMCTQPEDTDRQVIAIPKDARPFWEYDPLGAVVYVGPNDPEELTPEQKKAIVESLLEARGIFDRMLRKQKGEKPDA